MGKRLTDQEAKGVESAIKQTKESLASKYKERDYASHLEYLRWLNVYENTEHTDECLYKSFQEGPFTWHYLNGYELRRSDALWCRCSHQPCVSCGEPFDMWRSCSHGMESYGELCNNCCPINECEPYDYGEYRKIKEKQKEQEKERKKAIEERKRLLLKEEKRRKNMKIAGVMGAFLGGVFLNRLN